MTSRRRPLARTASRQRIFRAFVQSTYAVAVEFLLVDFQVGPGKKAGRQLLDRKTDGIRSAGKSSVPDGLLSPAAAGRVRLHGALRGDQRRLAGIVECGHLSRPSVCEKPALPLPSCTTLASVPERDDVSAGR